MLLGGHPHTGLFCDARLGMGGRLRRSTADRGARRRLAVVVGALALGAALAAIQIVPFLEYLFVSRGYTWRQFAGLNPLAAPASTLIAALVPRFLGEHARGHLRRAAQLPRADDVAGIPVLMLAAVGASRRAAARLARVVLRRAAIIAALAVYGAPASCTSSRRCRW